MYDIECMSPEILWEGTDLWEDKFHPPFNRDIVRRQRLNPIWKDVVSDHILGLPVAELRADVTSQAMHRQIQALRMRPVRIFNKVRKTTIKWSAIPQSTDSIDRSYT
jgi:hypothetical protein